MGRHSATINQVELVPAAQARKALPAQVELDKFVVLIDKENPIAGGFIKGTVKFPAYWSIGRASGGGFVELVPLSRLTTQMEITLIKPVGIHSLIWESDRLRVKATEVAFAIRSRFESRPEASTARKSLPHKKIRIGRVLRAGES
ncbi:MAG: hypothetical protein ACRD1T_11345 [Acidimicrobiia bacterium]